jgi:hypothetical protein
MCLLDLPIDEAHARNQCGYVGPAFGRTGSDLDMSIIAFSHRKA